jgi:hypothetical protein
LIKYSKYLPLILVSTVIAACGISCSLRDEKSSVEQSVPVARMAVIRPDYSRVVIPPNIAPLNFIVQEDGSKYYVKIHSGRGTPIKIFSKKPNIIIPEKAWHKLLNSSRGQELYFDVYVKDKNDGWKRFSTITNKIANEQIDGFLVYRKMHPTHIHIYGKMAIYCRNLNNYKESLILDNNHLSFKCINCHTFCKNRPDKMLMGVRNYTKEGDNTILLDGGRTSLINAKFGYTSWHPSGKLAAYSVNRLPMFYHTARNEVRDTVDFDSLLAYYQIDKKAIKTSPKFSRKDRLEIWPNWSPDGKYLYFCTAPMWWSKDGQSPPERFDEIKYDLVRIRYDINKDEWGDVETVLSSEDTGLSIGIPRISPDGRWLLFCMFDYGYFPSWQQSSDLYLMDLELARKTGKYQYRPLNINSNQSEAWQSWSGNSRWIAFSSKREYGVFTKTYLSYVDEKGEVYKPILLPQKNPEFYDYCLETYTVPELVTGPVEVTRKKMVQTICNSPKIKADFPITMATPESETTPAYVDFPQERE